MTLKVEDFSNSKGIEENTNVHAVIREEIGARGWYALKALIIIHLYQLSSTGFCH